MTELKTRDLAAVQRRSAAERITTKRRSQGRMIITRFLRHRMAVFGMVLFLLIVILAFLGPTVWRWDYFIHREIPSSAPPSWDHPFGTTRAGQDYLAQVMRGTQQSIKVGLVTAVLSAVIGGFLGAMAGLYGGAVDNVIMRFVDLLFVIPSLVILIVVAGFLGASTWWQTALILGAFAWLNTARVVRGVVLSLREQEFIEAARGMGASNTRIILRHLIPNSMNVMIVDFTLVIAVAILAEASLSFLGLGIQPPDVSLGFLINQSRTSVWTRPWLFYTPGVVIILIVLAINFIGDGLRDALDPRQSQLRR
ncbi:ABC transporter permease [Microlunatus sp. Gsoil 973]|uniref:ABC transporter permease n=1 Tax=Microlunatus sp. Gsoil 973 TaxID=2672569 RepID=UPI0012B46EC5|nr:ABC transporter permease [Microlunatus sp. Gsoil 973]QGN33014.1 ABC transporter permease subunit [Microlunatus sp. Gsoil 973]